MNDAPLYIIKDLKAKIKKELEEANGLIKSSLDLDALSSAKTVKKDSMEYYTNLRDMYVRVDFGNNVILPFYIDNNIAISIKPPKEAKYDGKRKLRSIKEVANVLGLKNKATIDDVQEEIKKRFDFYLPIESKSSSYFKRKTKPEGNPLQYIENTPWEASLKKFIGEFEKVAQQGEALVSDAGAIKKMKKISSILGMMELKQEAILKRGESQENSPFLSVTNKNSRSFDSDKEKEFLDILKTRDFTVFELITKESARASSAKMVGIFHLDELIEISPSLQKVLDMELRNKTNYKMKLLKDGELNKPMDDEVVVQSQSVDAFSDVFADEKPIDDEFEDDIDLQNMLSNY